MSRQAAYIELNKRGASEHWGSTAAGMDGACKGPCLAPASTPHTW